jgi:CBS domain-containing membrane protein
MHIVGKNNLCDLSTLNISDNDIMEAMKEIGGYVDITPGDARQMYRLAYRHALERLLRSARATDVMTRDVVSVKKETPLRDVAEAMARRGISGVPVIEDDGTVAGVISEKDFLFHLGFESARSFMDVVAQCLGSTGCISICLREETAGDIMKSPAITIQEETPVAEIAAVFTKKKINRVPVVSTTGKLMGIVSRADIVRSSFPVVSFQGTE